MVVVIPAKILCRNYHFCHSVQAKRDMESSIFSTFWIYPKGHTAGLRNLKVICDRYDDFDRAFRHCDTVWKAGIQ